MNSLKLLCVLSLVVARMNCLPIRLKNNEDLQEVIPNNSETEDVSVSRSAARNTIRPGMFVRSNIVHLEPNINAGTFSGELLAEVVLDETTRDENLVLRVEDLEITGVRSALVTANAFEDAEFEVDEENGLLTIEPGIRGTLYKLEITFEGELSLASGFYSGSFGNGNTYLAMNLHPTNARRVFPGIDEPTESSTTTFSIEGVEFQHIVSNSRLDENSVSQFRPMGGPSHLWGMIAHNFININNPIVDAVMLFGRPGVNNQEGQASVAINSFYRTLNEWTEKDYFSIVEGVQNDRMHVIAIPDVSTKWHSLSVVGIWEPYIFMQLQHGVTQRKTGLVEIANAISRQWFGFVIYPENWIHQWVITGLGTYAAYEALDTFQTNPNNEEDELLLDANTLFVTDVIQESLLQDSFSSSLILEPNNRIFEENAIRSNINGLVDYKAPALISMLRLILGDENNDFIHIAAKGLFISRSLQPVTSLNFIDAINSQWLAQENRHIENVEEFLQPYLKENGYPVVNVELGQRGSVILTQGRFGFSSRPSVIYEIPITFTTSVNPNFGNVYPIGMLGPALSSLEVNLGEEDWVLFNIQGRGYYRVNYGLQLWERIIQALNDPDERSKIHPLNRATLVDDSLNLARAGVLGYDIAFQVVLSMQLETEYPVWKAFVRNMNFLKKRFAAVIAMDEERDPDIYLRMVRIAVAAVEEELGFEEVPPNEPAMASLTRALVMDHACRSNYDPCIAAAFDMFYDGNAEEPTVNPNIPDDLRPAVYCTMARVGEEEGLQALQGRLEIAPTMYERVVILESLACSEDEDFINSYLLETIDGGSPYSIEERSRILKAVASSSYENANLAMNFLTRQTGAIRNNYGGALKLEEIIFEMVDNAADEELSDMFIRWVENMDSGLQDSIQSAQRARTMIIENLAWNNNLLEEAYQWISIHISVENDATTSAVSLFLVLLTFMVTMFNH